MNEDRGYHPTTEKALQYATYQGVYSIWLAVHASENSEWLAVAWMDATLDFTIIVYFKIDWQKQHIWHCGQNKQKGNHLADDTWLSLNNSRVVYTRLLSTWVCGALGLLGCQPACYSWRVLYVVVYLYAGHRGSRRCELDSWTALTATALWWFEFIFFRNMVTAQCQRLLA